MNDRVKIYREKQRAKGLVQLSFWLDAPTETLLKQVTEARRLQAGEVIGMALEYWAKHDGKIFDPVAGLSYDTVRAADLESLALAVEDQKARISKLESMFDLYFSNRTETISATNSISNEAETVSVTDPSCNVTEIDHVTSRFSNETETAAVTDHPPTAEGVQRTPSVCVETITDGFGSWLQQTREAAGLNKAALAKLSGVSTDTITRIETGRRPGEQEVRAKLQTALCQTWLGKTRDPPLIKEHCP